MASDHVLTHTEKSLCPACHQSTTLLMHRSGYGAMFYICFSCKRVYQTGKGEVAYENEHAESA